MKKNSILAVISSLVLVCIFSFLFTQYIIPSIDNSQKEAAYSDTNCLTDNLTDEMTIYDIAKYYRDSNGTVEIIGSLTYEEKDYNALGSGVVIASTGYMTSTLRNQITASKGSYIATNYHVVEFLSNDLYSNKKLELRAEDEQRYECEVLWSDKNLDVAVLYADVSFNYIKMADRWIECDEKDRLDYEDIFTIGSPVNTQYLNRLTVGNIASDNQIVMFTGQKVYPYTENGEMKYSYEKTDVAAKQTIVLDNVYEQVIDISLGISGGNSGGGCFDKNGYLVGLTTLGTSIEVSDANPMNGAVPIYPIMKVIDRLISNKETETTCKIYSLGDLGLVGIDSIEAQKARYIKKETEFSHYFVNDRFYSDSYTDLFAFNDEGYCILTNETTYTSLNNIRSGETIKSYQINSGSIVKIATRNDFIYMLLALKQGDQLTLHYESQGLIFPIEKTAVVNL